MRLFLATGWILSVIGAFVLGGKTQGGFPLPGVESSISEQLDEAFATGSPLERSERLNAAIRTLSPENLEPALAEVEAELGGLGECEISPFIDAWTAFDPAGALRHTEGWTLTGKRVLGIDASVYNWAIRDPLAAKQAVQQLASQRPRLENRLRENLIYGWAYADGPDVIDYLVEWPIDPTLNRSLVLLIDSRLHRDGVDAVHQWANTVLESAPDPFRMHFFRRVTRALARRDLALAADWTSAHSEDEFAKDGVRIVAERWVEQDPEGAFEYIAGQPERFHEDAVRKAFARWFNRSRVPAGSWLEGKAGDAFYDGALDTYVRRLADGRPETAAKAVEWAERIVDDGVRERALSRAAKNWYEQDEEATKLWLETSSLTPELRDFVRDPTARHLRDFNKARSARSAE